MIVYSDSEWWPLNLYKATIEFKAAGYIATTRIVQDVTFLAEDLPDWGYSDWNYGSGKHKQLMRNYIDDEEFQRVQSLIKRRSQHKYTSLALSLRGAKKNSRSQGWCMLAVVLTFAPDGISVETHYRTTEVVLKFAADIIFLRDYILPRLGIDPDRVKQFRFRFANCWIGGPYFAYLIDKIDVVRLLEKVQEYDPTFFHRMTRPLLKSCYREDQFHPFAPAQRSHLYLWKHGDPAEIRRVKKWLEKAFRESKVPLPTDFHDRNTYVPRGRRSEDDENE